MNYFCEKLMNYFCEKLVKLKLLFTKKEISHSLRFAQVIRNDRRCGYSGGKKGGAKRRPFYPLFPFSRCHLDRRCGAQRNIEGRGLLLLPQSLFKNEQKAHRNINIL